MMPSNPLRNLPSIHDLLENPTIKSLTDRISRNAAVSTVRTVLDEVRHEVQTAAADRTLPSVTDLAERIARRITEGQPCSLRPTINATGILLDNGLGRVPLADEALLEMAAVARDYASVDLDLATNQPLSRTAAVEGLLQELTGAEAALVVNNNAGATLLTLAALAAGREIIVARGQLIEMGESYRLPNMIAASGAVLREVGTTNKCQADDYAQAIGPATAALMLVHVGSLSVAGAESASLASLVEIGRRNKIPVVHNIGAGAIVDLCTFGLPAQPVAGESLQTGADLVLLCGDKYVGGPQAGIILGRRSLLEKIERHPLARALRVDKLTLAGLAATLRLYRDPEKARYRIPLLQLLGASTENLKNRAERIAPQVAALPVVAEATAIAEAADPAESDPARQLPTWCVAIRPASMSVERLAVALRTGTPSVVGRVKDDRLLLDLRTVFPRQDIDLLAALEALGKQEGSPEPPDRL